MEELLSPPDPHYSGDPVAAKIARIMAEPMRCVRLEDLLGMTDRQIDAFYCRDYSTPKAEPVGRPPERPPGWAPSSMNPDAPYNPEYQDPHHPLFKWNIPKPSEEAVCAVDGRKIDGEAMLDNLVRGGLLKADDVDRVRRERAEWLAAQKREGEQP